MKPIFKLVTATLFCLAPAFLKAQTYVADITIHLPGDGGYDYLAIDAGNNRLYVSHGTAVNVIDLATEKSTGTISDMKGVHGIAIDNKANKGFISDGKA